MPHRHAAPRPAIATIAPSQPKLVDAPGFAGAIGAASADREWWLHHYAKCSIHASDCRFRLQLALARRRQKAAKFSRVHTYKCCFCTRSVTPKWKPIVTSPVMLVLTAQSLLPVPVLSHRESNAACPAPDPYLESPDASVRDAPPAPRHAAISCPGDSD